MELKTERRKHKRLKYEARIFHNILSLGIIHTGKLYNLSFDGLYFESDQTLYSGEEINIWLGDSSQSAYDDSQPFLAIDQQPVSSD